MVEGEEVFNEAIAFLNALHPLKPFIWDENLAKSASEHVNDIGPKGLLIYQSSNGLEPEERIAKYGKYVDSLGENIDFGPNDAMGVIVSMTLDDGEEQRPHRENLFKNDYQKIGIACGPHQTEFQMCVMDFAYDFIPLKQQQQQQQQQQGKRGYEQGNVGQRGISSSGNNMVNNTMYNEPVVNLNLGNDNEINNAMKHNINSGSSAINNNNLTQINYDDKHMQHAHNPYVKLSLDNDDFMKVLKPNMNNMINTNNNNNVNSSSSNTQQQQQQQYQQSVRNQNDIDDITSLHKQVSEINKNKRVIKRTVEIITKVTYIYEDGSQREYIDKKCHDYNN